jgi:GxxExxY protein
VKTEGGTNTCLAGFLAMNFSKLSNRAEVAVPLDYDGLRIECAYRIDQLVEESLILELKASEALTPLDQSAADLR